ncbi:GNAT family N-acetyltransferase [Fusobacterium varium]|jgi:RimJ/RimL family protein N-acetyltransferase
MISGRKIGLKAIEKTDLSLLLEWRNNENYRKFFREYRELNLYNQEKWFEEKVVNGKDTLMFSIIDLKTLEIIGVCGLCYINWINGSADLSLYIGKDNVYIDEVGYAEESCQLLFKYGFNELRLNKIWTEIYLIDEKKIKLYKKIGMKIDGILRENYFYDGKYIDSYIFSILKSEFKIGENL